MSVDFTAILGRQVGSAPEPKPLPSGTYRGTIKELPKSRIVKTKEGEKGILAFQIALNEAGDDVDSDLLAESGGLLRNDGEAKTVRAEFWLEEPSMYLLDRFMAGLGFGPESGKAYQEAFEEVPGMSVEVLLETRSYQTKSGEQRTTTEVKRIHAA